MLDVGGFVPAHCVEVCVDILECEGESEEEERNRGVHFGWSFSLKSSLRAVYMY